MTSSQLDVILTQELVSVVQVKNKNNDGRYETFTYAGETFTFDPVENDPMSHLSTLRTDLGSC